MTHRLHRHEMRKLEGPRDSRTEPIPAALFQVNALNDSPSQTDEQAVAACHASYQRICDELGRVIIGQQEVIQQVMIALLARGHALLEGVPGLAKTLLIRSLASSLDLSFKRIQFTPDLMPSDVTGTEVIQEDPDTRLRGYHFLPGPIYSHLLLADEINRTPPKTQAAMLEAMQEGQVSAGGQERALPRPFLVLATQNPLEQEGTYPLPEAQLDRFLLYVRVEYPSSREEWDIVSQVTGGEAPVLSPVLGANEIIAMQDLVQRIPVPDQVLGYALALVRASRPNTAESPDFVQQWVNWGAGPRGVLALVQCAKAKALLDGRYHPTVNDIRELARPALRHRIAANYAAQANQVDNERLLEMLLEAVPHDQVYERPSEEA